MFELAICPLSGGECTVSSDGGDCSVTDSASYAGSGSGAVGESVGEFVDEDCD